MADQKAEEERLFFSNIIAIFTIVLSVLLVVISIVLNSNITLNGSTKPTPQQLKMILQSALIIVKYFIGLLALLSLASISRFMASWRHFKRFKKGLLRVSWFTFIVVLVYVLWIFLLYLYK
jgi:hypothetical protein